MSQPHASPPSPPTGSQPQTPLSKRLSKRPSASHTIESSFGFTLIELLVSLSIVAVLAGVAVPTLAHMRTEQRINAAANAMRDSIDMAKSQALRLAQTIVIAPAGCAAQDTSSLAVLLTAPTHQLGQTSRWRCGWVVVADTNHNGQADINDGLLRHVAGLKGVAIRNNVADDLLRVAPSGVVSPMQSMHFCPAANAQWVGYARKLVVAISGRIRTESLRNDDSCAAA